MKSAPVVRINVLQYHIPNHGKPLSVYVVAETHDGNAIFPVSRKADLER